MSDAAEIETLLAGAGYREVVIAQQVGTVRFASIDRMVLCQVAGSPLAGHVAKVDEKQREALLADMNSTMREYAGSSGFAFPIAAHLVRAAA